MVGMGTYQTLVSIAGLKALGASWWDGSFDKDSA